MLDLIRYIASSFTPDSLLVRSKTEYASDDWSSVTHIDRSKL
jgi:hypothetical protein